MSAKKSFSRSKSVLNPNIENSFTIASLKKMEVQKSE